MNMRAEVGQRLALNGRRSLVAVVELHPSAGETDHVSIVGESAKPKGVGVIVREHDCFADAAGFNLANQLVNEWADRKPIVGRIAPHFAKPRTAEAVLFSGEKSFGADNLLGVAVRGRIEIDRTQDATSVRD